MEYLKCCLLQNKSRFHFFKQLCDKMKNDNFKKSFQLSYKIRDYSKGTDELSEEMIKSELVSQKFDDYISELIQKS